MSWVVEWTDAGSKADMPHHDSFPSSESALRFADDRMQGGCRVLKMTGPHGEAWSESHIRVEIAKAKQPK